MSDMLNSQTLMAMNISCLQYVQLLFLNLFLHVAAHHGSKEPVGDFVPQICTLTSKQEAYCFKIEGHHPVAVCVG